MFLVPELGLAARVLPSQLRVRAVLVVIVVQRAVRHHRRNVWMTVLQMKLFRTLQNFHPTKWQESKRFFHFYEDDIAEV